MSEFKPAIPTITPHLQPIREERIVTDASTQGQTPPSATKRISSRHLPAGAEGPVQVGEPSKSPPPHINPPQLPHVPSKARQYGWQRRQAAGKKF